METLVLTARFNKVYSGTFAKRRLRAEIKDGKTRFFEFDVRDNSTYRLSKDLVKWLIKKRRLLKKDNPDFFKHITL